MTPDYVWSGFRGTARVASGAQDDCGGQLRRDPTFCGVKRVAASGRCLYGYVEFKLDMSIRIFAYVALPVFLLSVSEVVHSHSDSDLTAPQLCWSHYSVFHQLILNSLTHFSLSLSWARTVMYAELRQMCPSFTHPGQLAVDLWPQLVIIHRIISFSSFCMTAGSHMPQLLWEWRAGGSVCVCVCWWHSAVRWLYLLLSLYKCMCVGQKECSCDIR